MPDVTRRRSRWAIIYLAVGLLLAIVLGFRGARLSQLSDTLKGLSPGHHALADVLEARRPFEARLTGFDLHVPCPQADQNGSARCIALPRSGTRDFERFVRIQHEIRRAAMRQPSAANLHALGLAELLLSNDGATNAHAIDWLERAAAEAPRNASLLSDLSAAYHRHSAFLEDPFYLVEALAAADKALAIEPTCRPALFNRALALSRLYLTSGGRTAWESYIASVAEASWIAEAQEHLDAIEAVPLNPWAEARMLLTEDDSGPLPDLTDLARRFSQELTDLVASELLLEWTEAVRTRGRSRDAERLVRQMVAIGEALFEATGDPMVRDSVAVIADAMPTPRSALVQAHARFAQARASYYERDIGRAAALFREAEDEFGKIGSPYLFWTRYYLAVDAYWSIDRQRAWNELLHLRVELEAAGYRCALGFVEWMMGVIHVDEGRFSEGIVAFQNALNQFDSIGMQGHSASMRILISDVLVRIGEPRQAWKHLFPALDTALRFDRPLWTKQAFEEAADAVAASGRPRVALTFQHQALTAARTSKLPIVVSEALYELALAQHRLGLSEEARSALDEARAWLASITDPDAHRKAEAGISWTEGLVAGSWESGKSLDELTSAVDFFTAAGTEVFLPHLLLERAQLQLRGGASREAEKDLVTAIEISERQRRAIDRPKWRVSFAAIARRSLETLLALRLDEKRPLDEILPSTDRLRDVDFYLPTESEGAKLADWRSIRLPRDQALVSFTVLENRLVIWSLRSGENRLEEVAVPREELKNLVDAASELNLPLAATSEARSALYEMLIAPLASELDGAEALVIVPDLFLLQVPFAALFDQTAGELLIDRYAIGVTPSVAVYLDARMAADDSDIPSGAGRVLVVGDPWLETELPTLKFAAREARAVADLYGSRAEVLIGKKATKSSVIKLLEGSHIFHFAGHALANTENPETSRLVLAGDAPGKPVGLFAEEIRSMNFRGTKLVVLSACSTARTSEHDSSGILSLAAPFLAAGAHFVLASQVDIYDETSYVIATRFQYLVSKGVPPFNALKEAQNSYRSESKYGAGNGQWAGIRIITTNRFN